MDIGFFVIFFLIDWQGGPSLSEMFWLLSSIDNNLFLLSVIPIMTAVSDFQHWPSTIETVR
jgi:hypothetical protein